MREETALARVTVPGVDLEYIERLPLSTSISSKEEEAEATDNLRVVSTMRKAMEAAKKELEAPLSERIKAIRDRFSPWILRATEREQGLRSGLVAWKVSEEARLKREREEEIQRREEEERARAEEMVKAQEEIAADAGLTDDEAGALMALEADKAKDEILEATITPLPKFHKTHHAEIGSSTLVKRWTFEVLDIMAVPEQFVTREANSKTIRAAIELGARDIPGLRIYEATTVRSGR